MKANVPALTVAQIQMRYGLSHTAVYTRLRRGHCPGAWQDDRGVWHIPESEVTDATMESPRLHKKVWLKITRSAMVTVYFIEGLGYVSLGDAARLTHWSLSALRYKIKQGGLHYRRGANSATGFKRLVVSLEELAAL